MKSKEKRRQRRRHIIASLLGMKVGPVQRVFIVSLFFLVSLPFLLPFPSSATASLRFSSLIPSSSSFTSFSSFFFCLLLCFPFHVLSSFSSSCSFFSFFTHKSFYTLYPHMHTNTHTRHLMLWCFLFSNKNY